MKINKWKKIGWKVDELYFFTFLFLFLFRNFLSSAEYFSYLFSLYPA